VREKDPPRIRYLDGSRLRRAIIAGARRVHAHRDGLNAINVFPVADADTGSNMAGTLGAIADGIAGSRDRSAHGMLRRAADLALAGARGCSGTILAQFFHGLAEEFAGTAQLSARLFGAGVVRAVAYPYDALSQPREGTIITVLRDWGESVREWSTRTDDFIEVLHHAYRAAVRSLEATKEKLSVLRLAGVVDAGAQGFLHLLAGITAFITNGRIGDLERLEHALPDEEPAPEPVSERPVFRYCTQCLVEGMDLEAKTLRGELATFGDSIIVAGSRTRAKVHIHTDQPAKVVELLVRHGRVESQRVEDMRAQFRAAHTPHPGVAIVVDSACDLPAEAWERHAIHLVPCLLRRGEQTWLDKLTIDPETFHAMLRAPRRGPHPATSQPAPADYQARFDFLLQHYREVLSLSLSGSVSGTYDAARAAAKAVAGAHGSRIETVDTRSASIGMGLLARRAAEAVEAGASAAEAAALVRRLMPRVRIHLAVPSLDGLVRSGRVSPLKGLAANLLGLKPLIRLDAATDGRPVLGATVFGVRGGRRRILEIAAAELDARVPVEFAIAHADAPDDARWLAARIAERFALARQIIVVEATAVLVAHIGLGSVGVAYLVPEPSDAGGDGA
jgi:DegV family protein with EDD domain